MSDDAEDKMQVVPLLCCWVPLIVVIASIIFAVWLQIGR